MFIPLSWKEREIIRSMSEQKPSAWNLGNFSPYSLFPALPVGFIISLLFVLLGLLISFYLLLRLKLKFFRKFATLIVPIFLFISLAGEEGVANFTKKRIADPDPASRLIKDFYFLPIQPFKANLSILLCTRYRFCTSSIASNNLKLSFYI